MVSTMKIDKLPSPGEVDTNVLPEDRGKSTSDVL